MFVIETERFLSALKKKGYHSIKDFAKSIGVHRNTVHHYLSGQRVFPSNLEKMFEALDLKPEDVLTRKDTLHNVPGSEIATLIDELHVDFPNVTLVLFGSRAKGSAHKYADWDIGVYSADGLDHARYRDIVKRKNELCENLPHLVEIINLNRAEQSFLSEISKHWVFMVGRRQDWNELQRRVIL